MPATVILWIVMGVATAILYLWRKAIVGDDFDLVNIHDESGAAVEKQKAMAKTLTQIDRIMTVLIIITVVYGLALGGFYAYDAFINGGKLN